MKIIFYLLIIIIIVGYIVSPSDSSSSSSYVTKDEADCAFITSNKPGAFDMEVCKDEFSSEQEWKDKIDMLVKAREIDYQIGKTYSVYVKYKKIK
jgi:hypothetical protein